jgi:phosphoglycolate phosphatase
VAIPLVVGFDLDMTLLDTRPGIAATYDALCAQTGVHIDVDVAVSRLGPPLEWEIAHWFPPGQVAEAVLAYRALYPRYAIELSLPLPGAAAALDAVRAGGGQVVVITAKRADFARLHLDRAGLSVTAITGMAWAEGKADALGEHRASIYVGDHTADVGAALLAEVVPVGVATGPCTVDDLRRAGAAVVLNDLTEFTSWLEQSLDERGIRVGPPCRDG